MKGFKFIEEKRKGLKTSGSHFNLTTAEGKTRATYFKNYQAS